jgi:large subunit ribosomal protein L10
MALTRASKTEKVKKLATELEHSTSAIIGTFKGLTASKDFELRKAVRGAGGSYHVVKNKLAARAAEGTKIEAALKGLKGVSSVAYTSGDPVALAKALSNWVKDNAEFTFKSPAQRLATVINATGRDLAVVINQGVEKGKFAGPTAAPAAEAPATEAPAAEAKVAEAKVAEPVAETAVAEAPAAEAPASEVQLIAEAHTAEAPGADAEAAQPENSTASQGGEAATTDPVEG